MKTLFCCMMLALTMEKVTDSKSLLNLFTTLTEITQDGRPIEFFGWTEKEAVPPGDAACAPAVRADAERYLTTLVADIDWASAAEANHIATHLVPALSDFREILDNDQLERCDWTTQPEEQRIQFTRFKNTGTSYEITFTQGFKAN